MAALEINADEFIMALEDNSVETQYFLDMQTGEVAVLLPEGYRVEEDELPDLLEAEPERYLRIDPISSHRAFEVMADFAETVAPERAKPALTRALQGQRPFRAFEDALFAFGDVREDWFRYKDEVYVEFARAWLEGEGIEATLHQRRKSQGSP